MQFSKIATLFTIAAGVSALAVERTTDTSGFNVCANPPKGKCDGKSPSACKAAGGTSYKCTTIGLINLLNCVNLLDGNSVNVSIPVDLDLSKLILPLVL